MISEKVTVVNQLGMHARAAAKFVHLADRYQSRVRIESASREIDGKSIMGILLLAASRGSQITITADGADERDAVRALAALVRSGFGEDDPSAARAREGGPSDDVRQTPVDLPSSPAATTSTTSTDAIPETGGSRDEPGGGTSR